LEQAKRTHGCGIIEHAARLLPHIELRWIVDTEHPRIVTVQKFPELLDYLCSKRIPSAAFLFVLVCPAAARSRLKLG